MSKHRTNTTIWNRLRRGLSGILSLALLLSLLQGTALPAHAAEHWAMPYAQQLMDWGVMRGDTSGALRLEDSITRAEFVAMMNRAYGYTRLGEIPFTDVSRGSWYYEDINIGYNMGYFQGTSPTTASPTSPLTREQAAVLLARNMMLQPTVGETLGFSDTRDLAEWSRGLVGAASDNGILGGYSDGTFKPQNNITRGEVAAMLARAIGTPIQEEGDHTLGNVYGNVTVNTSGVKLRDGVITGNLYLTGGIDLGDVLMENITVLGEIIVSGGGESNSSESSVILRNVTANAMTVDSVSDQFVTIRAEGNTDIKTTTVRTNAYVDDSSLPGYGLWKIIQDGGSLLQLAGNIKEAVNQTPDSDLQVVQGIAEKVTIDEKATNSSVLVDGDARVNELDLDVATQVTGDGDIKDLNIGAAGSSVEQMPDTITIRPGITADINGSNMNSTQAAEASAEPRFLAGYPTAKNIAPTSATLVFSVNKPGTIYWAISAVSDGSVSEADLLENPTYGGKIIQAGTINAAAANTEYTANVANLSQDGSYYISAILVDAREKRSPVKVAAFATPDGTVPAFLGTPTATMRTTKTAQVTGMPNKSCLLYWALLPEGAAAPTAAEFKANAVRGNLGYGSVDVTKNVSQTVNVNRSRLTEKTNYVAYLWLTDYDGGQSSQVYRVPIYIPDETPPEVNDVRQTNSDATSVEVSFTMNETGTLHWAIVTDETHEKELFLEYDALLPENNPNRLEITDADSLLAAKIKVMAGAGADNTVIVSGTTNVTAANTVTQVLMAATRGLDPTVYNTSTFVMYYVGEDAETPSNLSNDIGFIEVNVKDEIPPRLVEQRFNRFNGTDREHPLADTDIELVFSESIQYKTGKQNQFLRLYQEVETLVNAGASEEAGGDLDMARNALDEALSDSISLYIGNNAMPVDDKNILDFRYAQVSRNNGQMIITLPHNALDGAGNIVGHAVQLTSGTTYHFELAHIYDLANNALEPNTTNNIYRVEDFRTVFAQVDLVEVTQRPMWMAMAKDKSGNTLFTSTLDATKPSDPNAIGAMNPDGTLSHYVMLPSTASADDIKTAQANAPSRIDASFTAERVSDVDPTICYDMLIWSDTNMEFTVYRRPKTVSPNTNSSSWENGTAVDDATHPWEKVGTGTITQASKTGTESTFAFATLADVNQPYPYLNDLEPMEYAIHVDKLLGMNNNAADHSTWNDVINLRATFVAGTETRLRELAHIINDFQAQYDSLKAEGLEPVSEPEYLPLRIRFTDYHPPVINAATLIESSDTTPVIRVTMDSPGEVHAIFVPLNGLQYSDNFTPPLGTTMETVLQLYDDYISGYAPAEDIFKKDGGAQPLLSEIPDFPYNVSNASDKLLELSAPETVKILGGSFTDGVVKATSAYVQSGSQAIITPPQNLTPDTIYLVCMVTQGSTPQARSENAVCFRLATETAKRPILTLTNLSSVNVNAEVNRTSTVRARLLLLSRITSSNVVFGEQLVASTETTTGNIAPGKDAAFTQYLSTLSADKRANYTVLDALQDTYSYGTYAGCSVFDEFASESLKDRVKSVIQLGTGTNIDSNTVLAGWGPTALSNPLNSAVTFETLRLSENVDYVCVAGAYITETGSWAFRALSPLQVTDDQPPKVLSVDSMLTDYTGDSTDTITGSIFITFDKQLYHAPDKMASTDGLIPYAQSSKSGLIHVDDNGKVDDSGDNEFWGLGGVLRNPAAGITIDDDDNNTQAISVISVAVTIPANNRTIAIPFQANWLCSKWNHPQGSFTVTLTWNSTTQTWDPSVSPQTAKADNFMN